MSRQSRRTVWCAAVLVAVALYAIIAERNSWRPHVLPISLGVRDRIVGVSWQDNRRLWVVVNSKRCTLQSWDIHRRKLLSTGEPPTGCLGNEFYPLPDSYSWCVIVVPPTVVPYHVLWQNSRPFAVARIPSETPLVVNAAQDRVTTVQDEGVNTEKNRFFITVRVRTLSTNRIIFAHRVAPPNNYAFGVPGISRCFSLSQNGSVGAIALFRWPPERQNDDSKSFLVFDQKSGKQLAIYPTKTISGSILGLVCAPDGKAVLVTSSVLASPQQSITKMQLFATHDGSLLWEQRSTSNTLGDSYACPVFSLDGRRFATQEPGDNKIRLFDAATGILQRQIATSSKADFIEFSPDGRTLATLQKDNTVTLWRIE